MTLWIVVGVVAIAALGFVCSWVLNARGGLEAGSTTETRKPGSADGEAREDASSIQRLRHGSG